MDYVSLDVGRCLLKLVIGASGLLRIHIQNPQASFFQMFLETGKSLVCQVSDTPD